MRRHKRKTVAEINLTPLLDVLFSILFIVMMLGRQNEESMKIDHQQKINLLEQENTVLKERVTNTEKQMSSYGQFEAEAVIITVVNHIREDNHYLVIKQGMGQSELETIQLGIDKTENTKARIEELITNIVENVDKQPVYIVFHCDKKNIYTTEYRAIEEAFDALQAKYKEVFFKVMEGNE